MRRRHRHHSGEQIMIMLLFANASILQPVTCSVFHISRFGEPKKLGILSLFPFSQHYFIKAQDTS